MMLGLVNDLVKLRRSWLVDTKLDTAIVKDAPRPVILNTIEQMLQKDYNVVAHKYHKDTLVGGDCHRLMMNSGEICAKAVDKCKKLEHVAENVDAQIDRFWRQLGNSLAEKCYYDLIWAETAVGCREPDSEILSTYSDVVHHSPKTTRWLTDTSAAGCCQQTAQED
jgi:hypothetical protein